MLLPGGGVGLLLTVGGGWCSWRFDQCCRDVVGDGGAQRFVVVTI